MKILSCLRFFMALITVILVNHLVEGHGMFTPAPASGFAGLLKGVDDFFPFPHE